MFSFLEIVSLVFLTLTYLTLSSCNGHWIPLTLTFCILPFVFSFPIPVFSPHLHLCTFSQICLSVFDSSRIFLQPSVLDSRHLHVVSRTLSVGTWRRLRLTGRSVEQQWHPVAFSLNQKAEISSAEVWVNWGSSVLPSHFWILSESSWSNQICWRPICWGQAGTESSQALQVPGTVKFHSRTKLSENLCPFRCENSSFRDTFVLLLDPVFNLLGLVLSQALTLHWLSIVYDQ